MTDEIREPSSLEFSTSQPRYESTARYTNDKNQSFLVRVSSNDATSLERYTNDLKAKLELIPDEYNKDLTDGISESFETETSLLSETIPIEEINKYLEISIDDFQDSIIHDPSKLEFSFGNDVMKIDIEPGETPHSYNFNPSAIPISKPTHLWAIINVKRGKIKAELLEKTVGGFWKSVRGKEGTVEIPIDYWTNSPAYVKLKISAVLPNSSYTLRGNIPMIG